MKAKSKNTIKIINDVHCDAFCYHVEKLFFELYL